MRYFDQRVRIQFKRPFGRTLALGILFLIGIALLAELIARAPLVQSHVPIQAYGTSHIQFEVQLKKLDEYLAQHGPPDCLFMGNSMALRGINPEVFDQRYKEITGEDISCYNFSVLGADASVTYKFIKVLSDKFPIKTIILGTNYIDFTAGRDDVVDERFHLNKWIDYHVGETTFKGWLTDKSYAFRMLLLFGYSAANRLNLDPVNQEIEKWELELTPYGYGYTDKIRDDIQDVPNRSLRTSMIQQYGNFSLSERAMENLKYIANLQSKRNIQIIIVEMPFHPSLLELYDNEGRLLPDSDKVFALLDNAEAFFQSVSDEYNVPFWKPTNLEIPDEGWLDRYHLNYTGSQLFSEWLAENYANAILSGLLPPTTANQ